VVAGTSAGYNYTATADIDVVVVADLNPDPVFREFFNENKYRYNGQHKIKIGDQYVKFYVQPADEKFVTGGSYSVISESWTQVALRRLTESQDTVTILKQADRAAQPKSVKKVLKKKVIREHRPVVYGYGEDFTSKNNLEQFKIFINNFAKEFKLPNIIKDHYIIEHTSKTELFISEYNSKVKEKITKYVWDLTEKLKKYNLTTEDVYKSSDLYKQFVRYALIRELPSNRVKLKESLDNIESVVNKITKSLGITTQSPNVDDKVDIVDLTVNKISHRIEIAVKSNETITEFKGDMYSTASGEIGQLGKHPGIEGIDTTTYFAPANTIKTNKRII
jgi:hypothetical protein